MTTSAFAALRAAGGAISPTAVSVTRRQSPTTPAGGQRASPRPFVAQQAPRHQLRLRASSEQVTVEKLSEYEQLAEMSIMCVDSGDLNAVREIGSVDATTNPLFVSQAAMNNDEQYVGFVSDAVAYAKERAERTGEDRIELAIDRLTVNLGKEITTLVPGVVSSEVDPRLSFDTEETLRRGRRIIEMYEEEDIHKERILIKVAGTWEGIMAAEQLEKEGITTNITLVFSMAQAVASAQRGAFLISPFVGRLLDWWKAKEGVDGYPRLEDPGVVFVTRVYQYYKKYGHETVVMPASWRNCEEIRGLAGVDRMTVGPALLLQMKESQDTLKRLLDPVSAAEACEEAEIPRMEAKDFHWLHTQDACAVDKLAEGIRAFSSDTDKLEEVLRSHPGWSA